ncbi:hypothetical protein Leryth_011443 [Lithospermum erythrorhizon]|nr:hypothetical protein Leryth_011443 [Lithospermum erythrorhizon]
MSPPPPLSLTPPPPLLSPPPPQHKQLHHISRRNAAVLLALIAPLMPSLHYHPPLAHAFSLGISGPKDWLREQKKKSAKYLLAPIDASRNSLQVAYQLISKDETGNEEKEKDLEEVKLLLRSAARDCVVEDRNSIVAFQANSGVEVCTFTLIVKNAADLLDKMDPVKLEAESRLSYLIRSFGYLYSAIDENVASNRQKVMDALMDTMSSLNNFEKGVRDCLEI